MIWVEEVGMNDLVIRGMIWELDLKIQAQVKVVGEAQEYLNGLLLARERLAELDRQSVLAPEPPREDAPRELDKPPPALERKRYRE